MLYLLWRGYQVHVHWLTLGDDLKQPPGPLPPSDWQGPPLSLPHSHTTLFSHWPAPGFHSGWRGKNSDPANIHLATTVGPMTSLGFLFFSWFPQSGGKDTKAPWGQKASLGQNPCHSPLGSAESLYKCIYTQENGAQKWVDLSPLTTQWRAVAGALGWEVGSPPSLPVSSESRYHLLGHGDGFSGGLAMEVGGVPLLSPTLVPGVGVGSKSRIFSSSIPLPCFWVSRTSTFVLEGLAKTQGHCKEGFPCRKLWMGSTCLRGWAGVLLSYSAWVLWPLCRVPVQPWLERWGMAWVVDLAPTLLWDAGHREGMAAISELSGILNVAWDPQPSSWPPYQLPPSTPSSVLKCNF